jgi:hypothetical protein
MSFAFHREQLEWYCKLKKEKEKEGWHSLAFGRQGKVREQHLFIFSKKEERNVQYLRVGSRAEEAAAELSSPSPWLCPCLTTWMKTKGRYLDRASGLIASMGMGTGRKRIRTYVIGRLSSP